ncbi:MAG: LSM domain-containing protein [Candidatus Methanofastidiosia archaeon]
MSEKPFDLIHKNLDKVVNVYLRDGRLLTGSMLGYDKDLNIALDHTTVVLEDGEKSLGRVIIRRNNILSISSEDEILWQE